LEGRRPNNTHQSLLFGNASIVGVIGHYRLALAARLRDREDVACEDAAGLAKVQKKRRKTLNSARRFNTVKRLLRTKSGVANRPTPFPRRVGEAKRGAKANAVRTVGRPSLQRDMDAKRLSGDHVDCVPLFELTSRPR
jgi:hypothetical protein